MSFQRLQSTAPTRILFGVFLSMILHTPLLAQWSTPVRISNRIDCFRPRLLCSNGLLHLIYGTGIERAFYQRSTDLGESWSSPFRIDQGAPGVSSGRPQIVANGDTVAACWYHNLGGTYNLGFRASLDGGVNWGPVSFVLPNNIFSLQLHDVALFGQVAFVVYMDHDNSIQFNFTRSTDLGATWSQPQQMLRVQNFEGLDLTNHGDSLVLLWSAAYSWQDLMELYFCRSTDSGDNWSDIQLLSTFDSIGSQNPCLALNERGQLAAFWTDGKYSPYWFTGDVFVRYSQDLGVTWSEEEALTSDHLAAFPKAVWEGDSLHLTWEDYSQDPGNISYMASTDNGLSWEEREAVDDNISDSFYPGLALTPGKVHLVWDDRRYPEWGIYYSRREEQPDAIVEGEDIPEILNLKVHPNPFNSATTIIYSNLKGGEIEIFDIRGQLIRTFFTGGENEGRIKWDATDASGKKVSSGIYFARAGADKIASCTVSLIYLK